MGYHIQYGQTMVKEEIKSKSYSKRTKYIVGIAATVALCMIFVWAGGTKWLRALFIPGDPDVTQAAFAGFVSDIRSGSSMGEAVTGFCREIIEGAKLS